MAVPSPDDGVFDVLILGGGLSGICSLYHIRERFPTWNIRALEAAEGPGGTWYWNRYPGARFDSESISYGYTWDKELLQEWHWKEEFSSQPETLRYINRVVERHDLQKDMQFNTRIRSAIWQDDSRTWKVTDENDRIYVSKFLVSCIGFLSAPTLPDITGVRDFEGQSFHTSRWPKDFVLSRDFAGKRIGVIGTGATGIQTITEVSKEPSIKSLIVFQRTANWSAPLRNSEISVEQMAKYREGYDEIFARCAATTACFLHNADPRRSLDVTPEERIALWEKLYLDAGFGKWLGVFSDTYTDRRANDLYSMWMAEKIRSRVNDPEVADSLIPKNHGFGTRRVPLESGYFEAYNQPNVHLVDLRKTPIEKIVKGGITTSDGRLHELDVLIYATGFDAVTGAFSAIDFRGKNARQLLENSDTHTSTTAIWKDQRPQTFLGITVPNMPNMFMVLGPHQPFGNCTRSIEHAVQVVLDLLQHCQDNNLTYVEPTIEAVDAWTEHVWNVGKAGLHNTVDSWMTGVNSNVKGKQVRSVARYAGSAVDFRKKCEDCKSAGWKGLYFA